MWSSRADAARFVPTSLTPLLCLMPHTGQRDVELFTEAIQLPTEERRAFLDQACSDDEDLRRRIEALLRFSDRAGDFLESPPTGSIHEVRAKVTSGEKPGDRIERYRLLKQIGEGGCGIRSEERRVG